MAKSSCFALVKALEQEGYLYEISPRDGYYPTGRMQAHVDAIAAHDPIVAAVRPELERLRDETGETAVLGKRAGGVSQFIAVCESTNSIRLSVTAGAMKPLHVNAMGKLFLAAMTPAERRLALGRGRLQRLTPRTIVSQAALLKDIEAMRERGWYSGEGESVAGAMGIGVPVVIHGLLYALQIGGPAERMKVGLKRHLAALQAARLRIEARSAGSATGAARPNIESKRETLHESSTS